MKPGIIIAAAIGVCLVGCRSIPEPAPTSAPQPTHTDTPRPTLTPSNTPTRTPTATPTPLTLGALDPHILGIGAHGAMACLDYQGEDSDLENVTLSASFRQNDKVVETAVHPQLTAGKVCFEMLDAFYAPKVATSIEVSVSGQGFTSYRLTYDLGEFDWTPFLLWVFGTSPLDTDPNHFNAPSPRHFAAYDLAPVNPHHANADHHPVYAPCTGYVTNYEFVNQSFHNSELLCVETGFVIQLGHMVSILENGRSVTNTRVEQGLGVTGGMAVTAGQEIGYLGWEPAVAYPHLHTKLMAPLSEDSLSHSACQGPGIEWGTIGPTQKDGDPVCSRVVDLFYPAIQGIGTNPQSGFWLEEHLPSQTRNDVLDGRIKPQY